jgi:hypothetical protein
MRLNQLESCCSETVKKIKRKPTERKKICSLILGEVNIYNKFKQFYSKKTILLRKEQITYIDISQKNMHKCPTDKQQNTQQY